jgi:cytochrome oxidase assembly protein ShyY1
MTGILFKSKYLLGHFLVALIAISCFFLSSWQFSRLNERKELNKTISSRMKVEKKELAALITSKDKKLSKSFIKENEYRAVSVSGKFYKSGSVLVLGRSLEGDPGYNLLVPFETVILGQEKFIYVNVGFLPTTLGEAVSFNNEPMTNAFEKIGDDITYSIDALIRKNESKSLFGSDEQIKEGKTTNRIDINTFKERIGKVELEQLETMFWLQLVKYDGAVVKKYPTPLPLPELTEKNHFSYAVQWILLGLISPITWFIICFKASKSSKVLVQL